MIEHPFSNGTEGQAWMDVWCDECAHDHSMHVENGEGGCDIILKTMIREPVEEFDEFTDDDGQYFMPPAIVCRNFKQCDESHKRDDMVIGGETHRQFALRIREGTPTIPRADRV